MCYKCGKKYFIGHQCKQKQINAMIAEATPEIEEEELEEMVNDDDILELQEEQVLDEAISLNALSGTVVPNTIKLGGESKKNKITVLLDSSSTHNFLDLEIAKRIGCLINDARPMKVTVANGNHITSWHTCPKFKWRVQRVEFEDTVRLVRLGAMN